MTQESELKPYWVVSSKFLGQQNGLYTYEITFNQSIVHTGRWKGIEDGLNAYRENEIKEQEREILEEADKIRAKYGMPLNNQNPTTK
jgi:hypothetical protein